MEYITIQELNKVDDNNGSVRLIYSEKDIRKAVNVNVSDGVYVFKQYDLAYEKRVKLIEHIEDMWGSYH
ncbi:hypothetical protein [Geomicrobium sp. JCM 19038]|uniref:hypothetical protein n=1 Tax=Geomicrobium sp. JCM 19038 TaxID=1460635 RepID=UPI00045F36E8|nr:hypothetical protein [Geomicrobium sp. JCM 19038]GAK09028.1 hypothetical protein JCM19038_2839 [Geomicrobium sp. JCM 19038]